MRAGSVGTAGSFVSRCAVVVVALRASAAQLGIALALLTGCGPAESDPVSPTGSAPVPAATPQPAAATSPVSVDLTRANLVMISLDTLRADGLSIGGGSPNASPALEAFAAQSVNFTHARATTPHTAPSHMTLFTGRHPSIHGVQNIAHEERDGRRVPIVWPVRPDIPTLAEVLKLAGFRTVALTDGGNLNPPHGFARGFDEYGYDLEGVEDKVRGGAAKLAELNAPGAGRHFFFWHTYEIHAPYVPPRRYIDNWAPKAYDGPMRAVIDQLGDLPARERFSLMRTMFWEGRDAFGWPEAAFLHGLYKGGIRYTDDVLVGLFDAMRSTGVLDNSIVIIFSDHGEEFFEHGRWQHEQLYEECLRVPLLVRLPGGAGGGRRVDTPVGLADIMPTVLDLLGVNVGALPRGPAPETDEQKSAQIAMPAQRAPLEALPGRVLFDGRSLADAILNRRPLPPRPVISEHRSDRAKGGEFERLIAIHANNMVWIRDDVRVRKDAEGNPLRGPDGSYLHEVQLFDLTRDPRQQQNLAGQPALAAILASFEAEYALFRAKVELEASGGQQFTETNLSPEQIEQLIQLGYLEGADALTEPRR